MLKRISQMFAKSNPKLSDESRNLITRLVASDIWILAIGVRGTPVLPQITDAASVSAALRTVAAHRKELSELGDDDSVFAFNFKRDSKKILPFFSSEERARHFLADSGFESNLSLFQPYCLLAGFVATPLYERFDLVLDLRSSSEHKIEDEERLLLRSLSTST